jgi:hypothetical protein
MNFILLVPYLSKLMLKPEELLVIVYCIMEFAISNFVVVEKLIVSANVCIGQRIVILL